MVPGFFRAALLSALALTLVSGARADRPGAGRFEASLGGFAPHDPITRADDSSTWTRLGVSWRLGAGSALVRPSAYFETVSQSGRLVPDSFLFGRRRRSIVGAGVGVDTTLPVPGGWSVDAGVGGGLYLFEIANDFGLGDLGDGLSQTLARGVNPGLHLRAALRNRRGLFVEVSEMIVGSFRGLRYDGTAISVGQRF